MTDDHDIRRAIESSGRSADQLFRAHLADRLSAAWNDELVLTDQVPPVARRKRWLLPVGLVATIGIGGVIINSVIRPSNDALVNSVEVTESTTPTTGPTAGPIVAPPTGPPASTPSTGVEVPGGAAEAGVIADPSIPTLPVFQMLSIEQFGDDATLGVSPNAELLVADPTGPAIGPIVVRWNPELQIDQSPYSEFRDLSTTVSTSGLAVSPSSTIDVTPGAGLGVTLRLQLDPSLAPWTATAHTVTNSSVTMVTVTPSGGAAPVVYVVVPGGPNGVEAGILPTAGTPVGAIGRFAFVRTGTTVEAFDIRPLTSEGGTPPSTDAVNPNPPLISNTPAIIMSLSNPPVPLLIDQPFASAPLDELRIGPLVSVDPTGSAILDPVSGVLRRFDVTDTPYDELDLFDRADSPVRKVLVHDEVAYIGSANGVVRAYALSGSRRGDQLAASPPTEYQPTTYALGFSGVHADYYDFDIPPSLEYVSRDGGPGTTIDLQPADLGGGGSSGWPGPGAPEGSDLTTTDVIMNGREFNIGFESIDRASSSGISVFRARDAGLALLTIATSDGLANYLFIDWAGDARSSEWRSLGAWQIADSTAAGTLLWRPEPDGSAAVARLPESTLVGILSDGTVVDETTDRTSGGTRLAFSTPQGSLPATVALAGDDNFVMWDVAVSVGPDLSTRHIDLRAGHRGDVIGDVEPGEPTDRAIRYRPLAGPEDPGDAFGVLVPADVTPLAAVEAAYPPGSGIVVTRPDTGGRWALSYVGSTVSARDFVARSDGSVVALLDITESDGRRWTQVVVLPGQTGETGPTGEVDWFRSFLPKTGCTATFTATATTVYALVCGTLEAVPLPG